MSNRQTRCLIYATMAVLIAVAPASFLGPMLFLLLMDAIGG